MATLKVYDGTQWNVVAGQGPPGAPGTNGTNGAGVAGGGYAGQKLIKTSNVPFETEWDGPSQYANWTGYTPRFATESGSEAGMGPGAGGYSYASYIMIAPYTMAIRTRFQWGNSVGNGGQGLIVWGLPPGYSTDNTVQYMNDYVWTGDGFLYAGVVTVLNNDIWMRPQCPFSEPVARYMGTQGRVQTSSMFPTNWYPNGGINMWGVLNVAQRW